MINPATIDAINKGVYASAHIMESYSNLDFILKSEESILRKISPIIKNKKILDIGIGGGRTTKFLLKISRDYTGIDYSAQAVQIAKNKYADVSILCCDARELKIFKDSTFDFVLFSFNGIDSIPHEGRIKALKEIYRVLNKDGFFMFSTHSRDHRDFNKYFKYLWKEKARFNCAFIKAYLKALYYLPQHIKMKGYEIYADEYAIINDSAHGFSLLHYYIGISEQITQLESIGFSDVEAYDIEGGLTNNDTVSSWIYYLSKK